MKEQTVHLQNSTWTIVSSAVMWSLHFPFFWSCVCHYIRFTTLRPRPVNIDLKQIVP